MAISNYPGGFQNGLLVKGVPIEVPHPGKVFWVNNSSVLPEGGIGGSDGNPGTYLKPFSTIDYAIGKCTANRGDVIYVMPGHFEIITGASGVDFDVAGIRVIGLGYGSKMATIDFNHANATATVDADDVALINLKFHADVTGVVVGLSIITLATDCLVKDCVFSVETAATDEFNRAINVGVGCDRLVIDGCKIDMGLGGAVAAISLVGATTDVLISRNMIRGDYSTGNITSETTASVNVHIVDNDLLNGRSDNINSEPVLEFTTLTTSGMVARNYILSDLATQAAATVGTDMVYYENFRSDEKGAGITGHTSSATIVISADA